MPFTVLCIDYSIDWTPILTKLKLSDGSTIRVEQAEWKDISLVSSTQKGIVVHLKAAENPWPFTRQKEDRTLTQIDLVLMRNFPTDLHGKDYRSIVMGFMIARIPAVNSFHSVFMCMNRILLQAEMTSATERANDLLKESAAQAPQLRAVSIHYFPNTSPTENHLKRPDESISFPAVIKVGNTHAGYGKMRVFDRCDEDDLRSIIALTNEYCTVEPLVEYEYEYRIQKIGEHVRCFRRNNTKRGKGDHGDWKNNWGNLAFENMDTEPHHRVWIEECAKIFGGLDICALDVFHCRDGEVAIELNDTACGLMFEHQDEDIGHMRDLIVDQYLLGASAIGPTLTNIERGSSSGGCGQLRMLMSGTPEAETDELTADVPTRAVLWRFPQARRASIISQTVCRVRGSGCMANSTVTMDEMMARMDQITVGVDMAYTLLSGALAGFAMLEGGIVTRDSTKNIMFHSLADTLVGAVVYYIVGYGVGYGVGDEPNGFIGTVNLFGFWKANDTDHIKWLFSFAFAAVATTIVSGATAERIKTLGYMIYVVVANVLLYPIIAHWMWSTTGWISPFNRLSEKGPIASLGAIDFAGDGAVHLVGAVPSFVGALLLGYRGQYTRDKERYPPRFYKDANHKWQINEFAGNNDITATVGAMLLWVGWYGFNCGSTQAIVSQTHIVGRIAVNTTLSAAAGGIAGSIVGMFVDKTRQFNLSDGINGMLVGLVAITGGCSVVEPYGAIVIGVVGAIICKFVSVGMLKARIDDPVDAVAVHGGGGAWGLLAIGFFATKEYVAEVYNRPAAVDDWGVFYGGSGRQLGVQLLSIVVITGWCALIALIVFGAIKLVDDFRERPLFTFRDESSFEIMAFGAEKKDNARAAFVDPSILMSSRPRGNDIPLTTMSLTQHSHSPDTTPQPTITLHSHNMPQTRSTGITGSPILRSGEGAASGESDSDTDSSV
ncbi:hypothetical protein PROFUN_07193 [Planoprotostelium fungivorum]|uniref:Ammonium transporter n=1 Tax=Planoprotostelium fungivorum TaxID=1890364 RepID=A0A2P6NMH1_9EUKA|nr:hypothetical protein PROFUN_07193 [Planoprotostelium fungivorum]